MQPLSLLATHKAIDDYNEVIRLSPNNASAHLNRGSIYAEMGDDNKAIINYNEVIGL
jgi:Flp pilus assembly protein TadD